MPDLAFRFRRWRKANHRRLREAQMVVKGVVSTDHPVLAHIIPIRKCNLSCTYCNEYDDFSPPVPIATMRRRLDRLAELGTTIVTLSGGEPMLHPDVEEIISHVRRGGAIAGMITNGYLLTADRIKRSESRRSRAHADQRGQRQLRTTFPRRV